MSSHTERLTAAPQVCTVQGLPSSEADLRVCAVQSLPGDGAHLRVVDSLPLVCVVAHHVVESLRHACVVAHFVVESLCACVVAHLSGADWKAGETFAVLDPRSSVPTVRGTWNRSCSCVVGPPKANQPFRWVLCLFVCLFLCLNEDKDSDFFLFCETKTLLIKDQNGSWRAGPRGRLALCACRISLQNSRNIVNRPSVRSARLCFIRLG
jgi:hypothetical protein